MNVEKFNEYRNRVHANKDAANKILIASGMPRIVDRYDWTESKVQERMMRCGVEARVFQSEGEDQIAEIAILTLIEDASSEVIESQ